MWVLGIEHWTSGRAARALTTEPSLLPFAVVTKHHNQKQLKEERVYFCLWSQRVRVHCGREAWKQVAGIVMIRKLRDHLLTKQRANWKWGETLNSDSPPCPVTSYFLQQGCTLPSETSPDSTSSWRQSVQMPEPKGLAHSNHHTIS